MRVNRNSWHYMVLGSFERTPYFKPPKTPVGYISKVIFNLFGIATILGLIYGIAFVLTFMVASIILMVLNLHVNFISFMTFCGFGSLILGSAFLFQEYISEKWTALKAKLPSPGEVEYYD